MGKIPALRAAVDFSIDHLTDRDFADAAERLDHWGDGVFASFGLGPDGIAELRARFAA
jgi:pyruvate kinase